MLAAALSCLLLPLLAQKPDPKEMVDSLKHVLIDDAIPRKTFHDKMMYPHRWYIKQLLKSRPSPFDTTYIISNKRKLTITLPTITKKNLAFSIDDIQRNKILRFSPNTYYLVGLNLSNIIVTFGITPGIKFGAKSGRGKTVNKDIQLTVMGKRVITDVNVQNYRGFYVQNVNGPSSDSAGTGIVLRPDVKTFSFGLNAMFVHNYKKYSLRGAFSFSDVQLKSAGSFMTGVYHSYIVFSSDSGLIGQPFSPYFSDQLRNINRLSVTYAGLSEGYGYTFVHRRLIISGAVNVGLGVQKINYNTTDFHHHGLDVSFSSHLNGRAAIRYDDRRFFTGVMATYDTNLALNTKLMDVGNSISRITVFAGYRFKLKHNGRKVLKAVGLVDYN